MPYTCHPLLALVKEVILVSRCIGLDTHILDIIQVLEDENLSEVFLVSHSYGGLVIGGAADKIPQKIRHLVCLDAYIP
jgi:pimeloyl-ACP methyl ester carboxylesterase